MAHLDSSLLNDPEWVTFSTHYRVTVVTDLFDWRSYFALDTSTELFAYYAYLTLPCQSREVTPRRRGGVLGAPCPIGPCGASWKWPHHESAARRGGVPCDADREAGIARCELGPSDPI